MEFDPEYVKTNIVPFFIGLVFGIGGVLSFQHLNATTIVSNCQIISEENTTLKNQKRELLAEIEKLNLSKTGTIVAHQNIDLEGIDISEIPDFKDLEAKLLARTADLETAKTQLKNAADSETKIRVMYDKLSTTYNSLLSDFNFQEDRNAVLNKKLLQANCN